MCLICESSSSSESSSQLAGFTGCQADIVGEGDDWLVWSGGSMQELLDGGGTGTGTG